MRLVNISYILTLINFNILRTRKKLNKVFY